MANPRGSGDQLRRQLVAAASEMLTSTQAIALPSLRAVARACDVSPAAVYLHFESQVALIAAVIDAQFDRFATYVAERASHPEPAERLRELARAYADWGLGQPGAYQLLFESADRLDAHGEHAEEDQRWDLIRAVTELIEEWIGVPPDQARLLAFQLWSGLHGIVSLRLHKPELDWPNPLDDEVAALVATLPARRA